MNEVNRQERLQRLDDLPNGQRFVLCRNGKKYTSLRRAESEGFIPARCDAGRYALLAAEWEVKPILKAERPVTTCAQLKNFACTPDSAKPSPPAGPGTL